MCTIAIIPARGGSKRIPGKNSKILGKKSLAKWTIDCAFNSKVFDKVIFSTDDIKLAEMARESGCTLPGLRHKNLAEDSSDLVSVCLDLIANSDLNIQPNDTLVLLQPTSPFRKPETIKKATNMIVQGEAEAVISFSKTKFTPEWLHFINSQGYIRSIIKDNNLKKQMPSNSYYLPNGLIYAIRVSALLQKNSFYTNKTVPLICVDSIESIDIDEPSDWSFAEYCLEKEGMSSYDVL